MRGAPPDPTSAYERARTEHRFLQSVRAVYEGHDDVLDALWWLEHPLQPGPSGAASPAVALREARHALYRQTPPPQASERFREAADREATMRADIAAALARVDGGHARLPQQRVPVAGPTGDHALQVAPSGRARDVFVGAKGSPRVAPLLRLPRATVYAVETDPPSACVFLITDVSDFRMHTVPVEVFEREGLTLQVDPPLAASLGLEEVRWSPTGEVRWTDRPVERPLGYF